ncbi:nuclear factor of activated T-cells, cytoplasmic 3 isoform X2 [Astyanax mexicanus]|uniref:nuclear factor of activated T-cells, cytoplasmic 3 isoform X2 n=1 Tax=Astyanax mexicanus TaxID=7994 RepID=UPI0020CAD18C|nr:nuclear factor of activated T-cells, cytoplasmic 3 isoform X2 [Astyanax mexicanus]
MTTANYGGSEELDFRLVFGEDTQLTSLGHTDARADNGAACYPMPVFQDQPIVQPPPGPQGGQLPSSCAAPSSSYSSVDSPSRVFDCPSIQITSIPASFQHDPLNVIQDGGVLEQQGASAPLVSRDQLYLPLDASYRDALCPSPCSSLSSRSWLSDASSCESFSHIYDDVDAELNEAASRVRLGSPLVSPLGSPLPSPLTSPQASPQVSPMVSPFGSPSCAYAEDPWFRYQQQQLQQRLYTRSLSPHQSPYQSPSASVTEETWLSPQPRASSPSRPSSRPTSPCGKRPYSRADAVPGSSSPHLSPSPSPSHSPRGSVTEETWLGSPGAMAASFQACSSEMDIPTKTRRTYHTQEPTYLLLGQGDSGLEDYSHITSPSLDSSIEGSLSTLKKEDIGEHYLSVPLAFAWRKPKQTQTPLFRSTSLPSLESPLPSQFGQFELKLEIQPKPHHRAHYETEGSRGAIKSPCGRHPVVKLIGYSEKQVSVQMFIGTADDRHVRPHPFYQVHRITGKTVATPSQEMIIGGTKILEIPLLPENSMSASIDCAGILKLRNSDIELRKGETDIGRKNTRVRIVFRVHIPQANGKMLSLQAASIPIECSQRSAQELPQIDNVSPTCGSVIGGQEMLITGPNITPESKVIFLEKGPDGKTQWEVDARTVCEKSKDMSIVVKIPPYHKRILASSTQVQFYISNGKRKRSPPHRFTYVTVQVKQEFDSVGENAVCDPAQFIGAEAQLPSDQVHPLEQWLYSEGPVCVPSSTQLSYSPGGSSYLNRHYPPDGNLSAGPELHSIFHSPSLDFSKPSFQSPQQNISYNGQPNVHSDIVSGGKSSPLMSNQAKSLLVIGHHSSPGGAHSLNPFPSPRYNEGYISPTSGSNQPDLSSLNHHSSSNDHVDLQGLSKSCLACLESPVSQQPLAYTVVPSTSALTLIDTNSTKTSPISLPESGASGPKTSTVPKVSQDHKDGTKPNIKEEPEEKELTFQSLGLQDITLDDVSEIIVRDLFQSPDPAGDSYSLP